MTTDGLVFTDCNTYVGRPAVPRFGPSPVPTSRLLAELDRVGVDGAIVAHVAAREYSPRLGNELLLTELGGEPRLQPAVTLLPPSTGETWPLDRVVDELRARDARVVRLYPGGSLHRYPFHPRVIGGLLEVLEAARVPTLVDFDLGRRDEADWPALYAVADAFPELPLIVVRPGGRSDRGLYPLLESSANVRIETGGYWVHRGLEHLALRFGADRLVFGSGFPYWTLSGAVHHVATAILSDEDRAAIAGGTLRRLIEGVSW